MALLHCRLGADRRTNSGGSALSPIFTFLIADVMGWLLRRTLWRRLEVALQVEGEPERHEPSGVAAPPG